MKVKLTGFLDDMHMGEERCQGDSKASHPRKRKHGATAAEMEKAAREEGQSTRCTKFETFKQRW